MEHVCPYACSRCDTSCPCACREVVLQEFEDGVLTFREVLCVHRLIGRVCTCGDWWAQCGHNIPEQWRQHVNRATPTPADQEADA